MAPFVTALHLFLTDKTVTHRDTIIRSFELKLVSLSKFCSVYYTFYFLAISFPLYSKNVPWNVDTVYERIKNVQTCLCINLYIINICGDRLIFRILISFARIESMNSFKQLILEESRLCTWQKYPKIHDTNLSNLYSFNCIKNDCGYKLESSIPSFKIFTRNSKFFVPTIIEIRRIIA